MEEHEDARRIMAENVSCYRVHTKSWNKNVYIWQCLFTDILKVLKIIDVDNKGYASKEDIQGMTLEQLKQIANEVDGDPANTEEYEFALFEIDSVR